jgi:uncharacterized lipoprotein YmbA
MKIRRLPQLLSAISLLFLLFTSSGCVKQGLPYYYYNLNSSHNSTGTVSQVQQRTVIGPIHLPSFLDQGQIISRKSPYSLRIEEQRRWAGELPAMIQEVISSNLASANAQHSPSTASAPSQVNVFQIPLDFLHFEKDSDGNAFIELRWKILSEGDTVALYSGFSSYRISPDDKSFEALVKALSIGLEKLSLEIAAQIQDLSSIQGT